MARKGQVSIQDILESNEDFETYLQTHFKILICMEVFSDFCGYCLATQAAIKKGKLEIGMEHVAMARIAIAPRLEESGQSRIWATPWKPLKALIYQALADNIDTLSRFREKSEPVFLFIMQGKLTRAVFGANGIELCRVLEEELVAMHKENNMGIAVPKIDIEAMLPEEAAKIKEDMRLEAEHNEAQERLRALTLAARKKRVCERMAIPLHTLNFIMFWPHCHQAHYDLYEKWDAIDISVAAKETFQLKEEDITEALYMSDIDPNEACVHALITGEALVVLFKKSDTDERNFVRLMRYALYEEIPVPKDDVPPEKQVPPIPAFERYASISKTARQVRRDRYNAKMAKLREEQEERDRLQREQDRLAREAEEERLAAEKKKAEEERMARIQAGLPADPEPVVADEDEEKPEATEGTDATEATDLPEGEELADTEHAEKVEEEEEFHSDVEIEGEEYIPPGGLFVPGLYSPPNDLARANAIAFFYPKIVEKITKIESEHLPPHVLVLFTVDKRAEIIDAAKQLGSEIIQLGFFAGDDPNTMEHVAYTLKQYEEMTRLRRHKDRLAVMVSRKRSFPMLQMAGFNPCYISSDLNAGERDCLTLFPVGYGDDYYEEESVVEEEVVIVEDKAPTPPPAESTEDVKAEEDEEEED